MGIGRIFDSGTRKCFLPNAPMIKNTPMTNVLYITLSDSHTNKSTHTCLLGIPHLPLKTRAAYIEPDLAHLSISVTQYCNPGCRVKYDATNCCVSFTNQIILQEPWMNKQNYGHCLFEPIQDPLHQLTVNFKILTNN